VASGVRRRRICAGIKDHPDHRRWTDPAFDTLREELVKASVEEVAKKIHRTPNAIRNMLRSLVIDPGVFDD